MVRRSVFLSLGCGVTRLADKDFLVMALRYVRGEVSDTQIVVLSTSLSSLVGLQSSIEPGVFLGRVSFSCIN
jgi:hypothetical protein